MIHFSIESHFVGVHGPYELHWKEEQIKCTALACNPNITLTSHCLCRFYFKIINLWSFSQWQTLFNIAWNGFLWDKQWKCICCMYQYKFQGRIVALDKTEQKIEKIRQNAKHWGISCIECYAFDSTKSVDNTAGKIFPVLFNVCSVKNSYFAYFWFIHLRLF